jgi:hypothetical protein
MSRNNFKGIIAGIIILAIVFLLVISAILVLSRPAQQSTTSPVYAVCGGETYNLNQTPFACGTMASGMMECRSTLTTNGMEIINITYIQENQNCTS